MTDESHPTSSKRWKLLRDQETGELLYNWDSSAPDDCDELFQRVREGTALKEDSVLFDAAMLDRFMKRVFAGEPVEPWIMNALADAFMKVMSGGEWNDEIRLPGRPTTPVRSAKDQRDLEIFCEIATALIGPETQVTATINTVAAQRNVSYETARAAYYRWKKSGATSALVSKNEQKT